MNSPEDTARFSDLINSLDLNEQFLIQLMKSIKPRSIAFFESIIGICEMRIKEAAENKQMGKP